MKIIEHGVLRAGESDSLALRGRSTVVAIFPFLALVAMIAIIPGGANGAEPDALSTEFAQRLAKIVPEYYAKAPGYSEGPTWRNGDLFFCSGALLKVDGQRQVTKYLDLGPAGTFLRGNGHILICDNKYHALLDLSPDGKVSVVADQFEGSTLNSLNDLTVDRSGNIYWTDPSGSSRDKPIGSVFRVTPAGNVSKVATGLAFPNGLEVDTQSQFLYVIESQTQLILRYALTEEGLGAKESFYDLGGSGGDGCVFDADGNLWVADFHRKDTGKGRITVLSPKAEPLGYINMPSKVVSNITFGGVDGDEIFCTTGEPPGVFHAKVGVKGFAGHPATEIKILRQLEIPPSK